MTKPSSMANAALRFLNRGMSQIRIMAEVQYSVISPKCWADVKLWISIEPPTVEMIHAASKLAFLSCLKIMFLYGVVAVEFRIVEELDKSC